jgi:hypothetical protein
MDETGYPTTISPRQHECGELSPRRIAVGRERFGSELLELKGSGRCNPVDQKARQIREKDVIKAVL